MLTNSRNPGLPLARLLLCASGCLPFLAATPVRAAAVLDRGHMDIGVVYDGGTWDLHVHKEEPEPEEEFAPGEAIISVGPTAALPNGSPDTPAATAFFGAAGTPLWVLPKTQQEELPFLGIGAEEMSASDWLSPLTLTLAGVDGPGQVYVWDTGALGQLIPLMNSREGIGPQDMFQVEAGSHAHYWWAFSAPGEYRIALRAGGVHATDGAVQSEPAVYRFEVVPEPSTLALLGLGAAVMARGPRRNRR